MNSTLIAELLSLLSETVGSFYRRSYSAIAQITVYSMLTLGFFSWIFQTTLSITQLLAFAWGSILISFLSWIALKFSLPPLFSILSEASPHPSLKVGQLLSLTTRISLGMMGSLGLGIFACYYWGGPMSLIGFSLGTLMATFFLRLGGGVFQSTSDIGETVLQDREKHLPHFDRSNPLTLLDIAGCIVGKTVGFGSDLILSFVFTLTACVLFATLALHNGSISPSSFAHFAQLPFLIMGGGLLACTLAYGVSLLRIKGRYIENVLLESVYVAVFICGGITWVLMHSLPITLPKDLVWGVSAYFHPFIAYVMGLLGAVLFGFGSEILTSHHYKPARSVAAQAEYGTALTVLNGLALGKKTQGLFLISMLIVMGGALYASGLYGIAMAAMGMLSISGVILSVTFFSPLATSLVKLSQLTECDEQCVKHMFKLDKIGNTTAALDHGFAAGVSILATFGMFFSLVLMTPVSLSSLFSLQLPMMAGLLIGVSLPELFSGYLLTGLSRSIRIMLSEISRQFSEIPYLREGKAKPDMIKAADLAARSAMDALIIPGILMVLPPIAIGYIWGLPTLVGVILGALLMGFATGFSSANIGGVLHSAKHFIQSGYFGGSKSPTYGFCVTADSIGDGFKDLISPSITIVMRGLVVLALYLSVILNLAH